VWLRLVLWTAVEIDGSGNWNHEWQEAILEKVVAPMWDLEGAEEAAVKLHEYVSDDSGDGSLRELVGDLNARLQRKLNSGDRLTDMVAKRGGD
jgi:hypothetical protein